MTPGPWKACRSHEDYEGTFYDLQADEKLPPFNSIRAPNGKVVAAAHDLFKFDEEDIECMAASKDMLRALREVQDCLACYRDNQIYVHPVHGELSLEELKYLVVDPVVSPFTNVEVE